MALYEFRNTTNSNIRDGLNVNRTANAYVVAIIGAIGAGGAAENIGTVTALGNGEYDVTTVGTATAFIFDYGGGNQSLVPAP